MLATSGRDGFGIKATRRPAGKSNKSTPDAHSASLTFLSHALHLPWPFWLSVHLAHPPAFTVFSPMHTFIKGLQHASATLYFIFTPFCPPFFHSSNCAHRFPGLPLSILNATVVDMHLLDFALINFDTHALSNETDGWWRKGEGSGGQSVKQRIIMSFGWLLV